MPSGRRVEQELGRLVGGRRLHVAGSLAVASIYHHPAVGSADPVRQSRAMRLLQLAKRPIGIRNHVDAARSSQQDGVFGGRVAGRSAVLGCFEDLPGVLNELAHEAISRLVRQIRGNP